MTSDDPPVPRGVSRETLLEILAGWYGAGAAEEPVHTGDVADRTSVGQRHRLTDRGVPLAAALADGEDARIETSLSGADVAVGTAGGEGQPEGDGAATGESGDATE